jgi:hypothetical protein
MNDGPFVPVVTNEDWDHAFKVLEQFISMEHDFSSWISNDENWELEEFDA